MILQPGFERPALISRAARLLRSYSNHEHSLAPSWRTVIGEPMVVHRLIRSLCRFATDRVKPPVDLGQVDIGRQGAKRAALRHPDFARGFDNLLDEMHDLGILDALGDFIQLDRVSDRVERPLDKLPTTAVIST